MPRRAWAAVVTAAAVASCNPFGTGTPDPPAGVVIYPPPTSPENVLATLALALGAKDNLTYLERLTEDFLFRPDPVQAQGDAFRNLPARWGIEQERAFLAALMANADSLALIWQGVLVQPQGDGARVTANYELTVWARAGPVSRYTGQADLLMRQTAGIWSILSWDDVVREGMTATWGLLRADILATG